MSVNCKKTVQICMPLDDWDKPQNTLDPRALTKFVVDVKGQACNQSITWNQLSSSRQTLTWTVT